MKKKKLEKIISQINPGFDAEASLDEIKKKIAIYEECVGQHGDALIKTQKKQRGKNTFIPIFKCACIVAITAAILIPTTMVICKNNTKNTDVDLAHLFESYEYLSVSSNFLESKKETLMVFYGVKDDEEYLLYAHNSSYEMDFFVNNELLADNARGLVAHTYLLNNREDFIYEFRFGENRIKSVFQTSYYSSVLGGRK